LLYVRTFLYGVATLALLTLSAGEGARAALAGCASALFEATPFLLAGIAATQFLRRYNPIVEYLGCGCGTGPSARSLPAAAAVWYVFGAPVAIARLLAAILAARLLHRNAAGEPCAGAESLHPLGALAAVVPAAALAACAMQLFAAVDPSHFAPIANALLGAALGFAAAPCGLGAVALAGALRVHDPVAAAAFLCIAGIVDARALFARSHRDAGQDAFGYALLAIALAVVAARRGDALVHPALSVPLAICAGAALGYAFVHRRERCASARFAPAVMLAGALLGSAPPQYRATETTLTDLFTGERLSFTGALVRDGKASAVVRYAITCCRADAAPVAVRLDRTPPLPSGTWLRVDGSVENVDGELRLVAAHIERITPPSDPFIYR
jgi:hypothetical protein